MAKFNVDSHLSNGKRLELEEVSWFECDNGRDMAYSYAWSMLQLGYRTTVIRSLGVYGVKVQDTMAN